MAHHIYSVGGLEFSVCLPADADADALLPSFRPFRRPAATAVPLFVLAVCATPQQLRPAAGTLLDELDNDMGHTRLSVVPDGYRIDLHYAAAGCVHTMVTSPDFTRALVALNWSDPAAGLVLGSLLRIVYSQAALLHGAVSIHAAAVHRDGRAYLFMGRSGTGKSTHARQWLATLPGATLLNDDNPVVRLVDGRPWAYGSPWSGKTPCYRDEQYPVGGIVRLVQSPVNRYEPLAGTAAFVALYPGCSVITTEAPLHDALCATLSRLADSVPLGQLFCRPEPAAALLCWNAFNETR